MVEMVSAVVVLSAPFEKSDMRPYHKHLCQVQKGTGALMVRQFLMNGRIVAMDKAESVILLEYSIC